MAKILIVAGGTGGHLYPGIALARELVKKKSEVLFVVQSDESKKRTRGPSAESVLTILKKEGFEFKEISCAPFLGQSFSTFFRNLRFNLRGTLEAFDSVLPDFDPDCAVSFGSYVGFPVVLAAWLRNVPVLLHEQNVIPGMANRVSAPFSKAVAVSFSESGKFFGDKSLLVGNLVRNDIFDVDRMKARETLEILTGRTTVLIFGGSGGARPLNRCMLEAAEKLSDLTEKVQFVHLTGNSEDSRELRARYRSCGFHASVLDYSHQMGECYAAADLVISRSGASTVAELIASKVPSILVPYPHAAGNHQKANAKVLEALGASVLLEESPELPFKLAESIRSILDSEAALAGMSSAYKNFPVKLEDAAGHLAEAVLQIAVHGKIV